MPLQDHKIVERKRFNLGDHIVLKLPKLVKDEDDEVIYPVEVLKDFIKYFNNLYQEKVVQADRFIVDDEDHSHLDLFIYVPGELTREDFLDDLRDFEEDHPGVKAEIIKRWPKEKEQAKQGIQMAKSAKGAYPERKTFEGLKPEELEVAKKYFKEEYDREFNPEDPDDKEDIVELFNENQRELREWYPADIRLSFNVGKFAPGKEGDVDLLSLYDSKKVKDDKEEIKSEKLKDKKVKDEDNPLLRLCHLLGEAHDKVMEAQEIAGDLIANGEVSSSLEYDLDDLEADLSEFEFMGENDPVAALLEKYAGEDDEW